MNLYQEVALSFKKIGDPWYMGYFYCSENLNWAAYAPRVRHRCPRPVVGNYFGSGATL